MFEKIRNGEIQWINGIKPTNRFTLVFFLALKLGWAVEKHPLYLASASYSSYRVEGSSICINMYLYLYHVFGTVLILELESRCDNRGIQFPFTLRCPSLIWYRTPGERTLFCIMHTCIHTRFLFLFVFSFIWWGLHSIARFSCNHVISQICANIQLFWVSWISDIIWLETSCLVEFRENTLG